MRKMMISLLFALVALTTFSVAVPVKKAVPVNKAPNLGEKVKKEIEKSIRKALTSGEGKEALQGVLDEANKKYDEQITNDIVNNVVESLETGAGKEVLKGQLDQGKINDMVTASLKTGDGKEALKGVLDEANQKYDSQITNDIVNNVVESLETGEGEEALQKLNDESDADTVDSNEQNADDATAPEKKDGVPAAIKTELEEDESMGNAKGVPAAIKTELEEDESMGNVKGVPAEITSELEEDTVTEDAVVVEDATVDDALGDNADQDDALLGEGTQSDDTKDPTLNDNEDTTDDTEDPMLNDNKDTTDDTKDPMLNDNEDMTPQSDDIKDPMLNDNVDTTDDTQDPILNDNEDTADTSDQESSQNDEIQPEKIPNGYFINADENVDTPASDDAISNDENVDTPASDDAISNDGKDIQNDLKSLDKKMVPLDSSSDIGIKEDAKNATVAKTNASAVAKPAVASPPTTESPKPPTDVDESNNVYGGDSDGNGEGPPNEITNLFDTNAPEDKVAHLFESSDEQDHIEYDSALPAGEQEDAGVTIEEVGFWQK